VVRLAAVRAIPLKTIAIRPSVSAAPSVRSVAVAMAFRSVVTSASFTARRTTPSSTALANNAVPIA
jgi:hypothetical protein